MPANDPLLALLLNRSRLWLHSESPVLRYSTIATLSSSVSPEFIGSNRLKVCTVEPSYCSVPIDMGLDTVFEDGGKIGVGVGVGVGVGAVIVTAVFADPLVPPGPLQMSV